jgi:hypothetical protein
MESWTLRQKILTTLAACMIFAAILYWTGASWVKMFELSPTPAIVLIAVFTIEFGIRKTRRFHDPEQVKNYRETVWNRGTVDGAKERDATFVQSGDRLVAYADRIVDRQINKARGILPFNSIIMTVLSIERSRLQVPNDVQTWISIIPYWLPTGVFFVILVALGISSGLCLMLFLVHWGPNDGYATFRDEFDRTLDLISRRSIKIQWATVLSEACLFVGLCLVVMTEASVLSHPAVSATTFSISIPPPPARDTPAAQVAPPAADH